VEDGKLLNDLKEALPLFLFLATSGLLVGTLKGAISIQTNNFRRGAANASEIAKEVYGSMGWGILVGLIASGVIFVAVEAIGKLN
jgi:hypothetical protein